MHTKARRKTNNSNKTTVWSLVGEGKWSFMILEHFIHHHDGTCGHPTPLIPQLGDFFKLDFFVYIFYVINFFIFWLHFDEKLIFSHHSLEIGDLNDVEC